MNSTLQLLLHIPELNSFFINIYPKQKDKFKKINKDADTKGRLSEEYYDLVKNMKEFVPKKYYYRNNYYGNYYYYSKSISPKTFNNVLSVLNPQFGKFESNDSKDLILYLIQSMHAELNYIENQKLKSVPKCNQTIEMDSFNFFLKVNSELNLSIFSYLFYGIIKSSTICLSCKNVLYNYQYFQFLSFPTFNYKDKKMNLYQGLNDFKKPEIMKGDNKCYCQKCQGLRDAEVSSEIFYTPPYLLINFDYGKNKKFSPTKVDFGAEIDLTDFTDKKCIEKKYELIGVSTHIGASGNSSHYIAYCKDIKNQLWYQFNDSFVNKCSFNEVNSNTPYLLVFKKKIEN
jgi:ubiquitin C-terminal hydrolase